MCLFPLQPETAEPGIRTTAASCNRNTTELVHRLFICMLLFKVVHHRIHLTLQAVFFPRVKKYLTFSRYFNKQKGNLLWSGKWEVFRAGTKENCCTQVKLKSSSELIKIKLYTAVCSCVLENYHNRRLVSVFKKLLIGGKKKLLWDS